MTNSTTAFFCCTSTRTAIGDGFVELIGHLSRTGDIVIIKGEPYQDSEFPIDDERILTLRFNKQNLLSYFNPNEWLRLKRFLSKNKVSNLFIYSTVPINWPLSLYFKKATVYFWCHDPMPHPGEPSLKRHIQTLDRNALFQSNRTALVLVSSEYLKGLVCEQKGVSSRRIKSIVLPWIEAIVSHRTEHQWSEREYDLIFWGRIELYKGLPVLSEALELLEDEGYELKVLIAGSGPAEEYLSDTVLNSRGIRLENRFVPNEELADLISNSRIAVFPYTSSTGSQVIQTALAMGCIVIASDVGSFPEYLSPESRLLGKLVPAGDASALAQAIKACLEEPDDTTTSKETALRVFSPEKWAVSIETSIFTADRESDK